MKENLRSGTSIFGIDDTKQNIILLSVSHEEKILVKELT
jgi:hypothetical protein